MSFVARALRHRSFVLGAALTLVVVLAAAISLVWTPQSATALSIVRRLRPPSEINPLGTDHLGRDVLSMLMVGAQNSIAVGVVAVAIGSVLGVTLGLIAAARRGWIEELVMRFSDFAFAFPAVLSAIMITSVTSARG